MSDPAGLAGAVAGHYDALDGFYREVWGDHLHHGLWADGGESRELAMRQMVERVASEAQVGPGRKVCDIGCGYGAAARILSGEYRAEVTALTVSPRQFAYATQVAPGGPRYLLEDWLDNTLAAGSFDAAIAIECAEHIADKAAFFAQAQRVLVDGGRLVICAWLARETPTPAQRRWLLGPICRESRFAELISEREYLRLAEGAGFELEQVTDVSAQVRPTWLSLAGQFLRALARRPGLVRFLFNRHAGNRVFALTMARIWVAYRTGALRYGIFTFRTPTVAAASRR